jgi:PqqD family protein of HPr-rel-A system
MTDPSLHSPAPRPVPDIAWRRWEDGAVVYRLSTGETHVLDPATAAVFITLCHTPGGGRDDMADTLRAVLPDAEAVSEERLHAWLDALVQRLADVGLLATKGVS